MIDSITCPFCNNTSIEPTPGKTICPSCHTGFEIDDRLECMFADTDNMRLPINGIVCGSCGLIQRHEGGICLYCGVEMNGTLQ